MTNHKVTDYGKTLARILRPRANEIHASVLRFAILAMRTTLTQRLTASVTVATNGPNPRKSTAQRSLLRRHVILSQGLYLGLDYRIIGKSMFLCGLQSKLQVHVV